SWRRAIASGSVSGAARRWASARAPAAVTLRSMAARSDPRRSPESVRTSSRLLRVAWSIESVAPCVSRTGADSGGAPPTLRRPRGRAPHADGARGAARRNPEPGRRAEASRRQKAKISREPALGRGPVEHVARERRHRRQRAQIWGERAVAVERVRHDDLARFE